MKNRIYKFAAVFAFTFIICCFFVINVSAAQGDVKCTINYDKETITVGAEDAAGNMIPFSGTPEIVYCITGFVSSDDTSEKGRYGTFTVDKEKKWYPVYGNEVNINKYIPYRTIDGKVYIITFKNINHTNPANRTVVSLKDRPNEKELLILKEDVKKQLNKNITYIPDKERIQITLDPQYRIEYRTFISTWTDKTIDENGSYYIDANVNVNKLGSKFEIRIKAGTADFASKSVMFTIPKQPSGPFLSLKYDKTNGNYIQTKNIKSSYNPNLVSDLFINYKINNQDNWVNITGKINEFGVLKIDDIKAALGSTKVSDFATDPKKPANILLELKSENTDKYPESAVKTLSVPKYFWQTPTLTISDIILDGVKNSELDSEVTIELILKNDEFTDLAEKNYAVSSWFTGLPTGFKAVIDSITGPVDSTSVMAITITGKPQKATTDPIVIKIPGKFLTNGFDLTTAENLNAKYNVTE